LRTRRIIPPPLFDTERLAALWAPTVHLVADGIGLPLDRVETSIEKCLATERYEAALGCVEPGTMGGMRFKLAGMVERTICAV
jgi:2,4-diaminopentanoate dehydrogenase